MTKIINERPPNFDEIVKLTPGAANPGVIFAYDDAIYNPSGIDLPEPLIVHEEAHLARQKLADDGAAGWWRAYLTDAGFRYYEELLAHRAELQHLFDNAPGGSTNRQQRRRLIAFVAKRLSSKLYQHGVNFAQAKRDLAPA